MLKPWLSVFHAMISTYFTANVQNPAHLPQAVILPTTKLWQELWKRNLEEEKVPPCSPGYLWSKTQIFKGESSLEVASSEILLVLAHLILELSGQLCRTPHTLSRDIRVCVRSFSSRNSHTCLKRETQPRSGNYEGWAVNTVEPCWQDLECT